MREREKEEEEEEDEEGSGAMPYSLRGLWTPIPHVETLEDQQMVEEEVEREFVPICRVRRIHQGRFPL